MSKLHLSRRIPVGPDLGPTLLQCDLSLARCLCYGPASKQSRSEGLGGRTSTFEFGEDTVQPIPGGHWPSQATFGPLIRSGGRGGRPGGQEPGSWDETALSPANSVLGCVALGHYQFDSSLRQRDPRSVWENVCKALCTAPGTHRAPPKAALFSKHSSGICWAPARMT